jgi:hypothetical protein
LFRSSGPRRPIGRKARRFRLLAESLEDRAVPATVMWDGGAGSFEFNDAANWNNDIVPGPGDDVVIPALPGNQAVITRGILSLGSIRSDSPIVLRGGISNFVLPGRYTNGALLVTAGVSKLSKGLYVDFNVQNTFEAYATGSTTSLTIDGPVQKVNSHPGSSGTIATYFSDYFWMKALDGATIRLNSPGLNKFTTTEIVALNQGSKIEINGQTSLEADFRMTLAAAGGATLSMPDLKTITVNANAERVEIKTGYEEYVRWYNGLGKTQNYQSGIISFPKLSAIDDLQSGRTQKTIVSIGGTGSRFETPELRSITNASIYSYGAEWNAAQLRSLTRSQFTWNSAGKTTRFDSLVDIADTSITVNQGFVEIAFQAPIDLANTKWDTTWKSDGPLSSLTISTPEMRGQLGQGHFFRIEASNGGLVTLNSGSLTDDNDSKSDGGIFLKADTAGVLRMNVADTRGTIFDLYENGIAAFDQVVDARFKTLRGSYSGKSGKLYGSRMKSLTVDTQANLYDLKSLVAPSLESLSGNFAIPEGWNPPVFPAYRTVTWDGGAGTNRWSDSANWSDDRIPGPNTTVIIPAQSAWNEILIDASANVRSIESHESLRLTPVIINSPITLLVTSGASILHAGVTLKSADLATRYSGTTLDVYGTTKVEGTISNGSQHSHMATKPAKIGFSATDGSWLFVHDTSKFDSGLIELDIRSTGGGSRVVFPSLATAAFETPRTDYSRSIVRMTAENRAEIDLPQLRTLTADLIFVNIDNSWISSPKLNGISRASIRIVDPTNDGIRHSDWITGELAYLTSSILLFDGSDVIESFDKVKSIDGTVMDSRGSKVYFPALDKIDVSKFYEQRNVLNEIADKSWSYRSGYYSSGSTALIEIRAKEMSGTIPDHARFEIYATNHYLPEQGGMVSLQIPVMKFQQSATVQGGKLVLFAAYGGVLRAEATTVEGLTVELYTGGAVAIDNVHHGKFRQISRRDFSNDGSFYAANMELMTITEPDLKVNTNLNMIVAPKLRMINGNFETVANPFPLLESITGSILLKHEPGVPVSQITVFDTPKIGRITNLSVTMEQGVRWPQLEAQADWSGVSVYRLNEDGSKSAIVKSEARIASMPAKAATRSATVSAAAKPAPKPAAKPKALPKPAVKRLPNVKPAPKPAAVKPAPAKKVAAKPAPKPQLTAQR